MILPFGTPTSSCQNTPFGPLVPMGKAIGHPERELYQHLFGSCPEHQV